MTDEAEPAPAFFMPPGTTWLGAPLKPDPDVPATWRAEQRLAFYVGSFVLEASSLDANLTALLMSLIDSPLNTRPLIAGRMVSDKIRMLRTLIPADWADLPRALDRIIAHRNTLAHSSWLPDIEAYQEGAGFEMVLLREKKPDAPFRVDYDQLWAEQTDQRLVSHVITRLIHIAVTRYVARKNGDAEPDPIGNVREWTLSWANDPMVFGWPKEPQWADDVARAFRTE